MEENTKKRKWRFNIFDAALIAAVLAAAWFTVFYLGRPDGGAYTPGDLDSVVYTIEFVEMFEDAARMIMPGDELVDRVEKRHMGTVVSAEVVPSTRLTKDEQTGVGYITEYPGRVDVIVTVRADATVTESQISVPGGYVVRAGVRVSVNGPKYHGAGFITDIERGAAS